MAAKAVERTSTTAVDTETLQIIQVPGTPPADSSSGARLAISSGSTCIPNVVSPATGAAGTYVANVCVTVGSVGKFTGTGASKHVIFNNLTAGSRPHVFKALNNASKTTAVAIPAGSVASSCSAARFNTTGGLNYTTNVVVGWSTFPGVQYCP